MRGSIVVMELRHRTPQVWTSFSENMYSFTSLWRRWGHGKYFSSIRRWGWSAGLLEAIPAVDERGEEGRPLHLLLVPGTARGRAQHRPVDLLTVMVAIWPLTNRPKSQVYWSSTASTTALQRSSAATLLRRCRRRRILRASRNWSARGWMWGRTVWLTGWWSRKS